MYRIGSAGNIVRGLEKRRKLLAQGKGFENSKN
jgi:hypothetical protein